MSEKLAAWLIVLVGAFALCGGILNWNWFMNNRKAVVWVKILGRGGARIFYCLLGIAMISLGVALMAGWLPNSGR